MVSFHGSQSTVSCTLLIRFGRILMTVPLTQHLRNIQREKEGLEPSMQRKSVNNAADILHERLSLVNRYFDIKEIIHPRQGKKEIQSYYLASHFAYLFLISMQGFMHMGLSYDGKYKKEDLEEQATIVERYIKEIKAKKVLELGCGNGPNSAYLAKKHKGVSFIGVDLSKGKLLRFKPISNYSQLNGDYHDLSRFQDESFDVVFAIETICHSTDKKKVLEQVHRKLKKSGFFIIFDFYAQKSVGQLTPDEKMAKKLAEKTWSVEEFETIDTFRNYVTHSNFSLVKEQDLTDAVLPSMKRIEKMSLFCFRRSFLAKGAIKILPLDMVKNVISGLLMVLVWQNKRIGCYYLHVLKK